MRMWGREKLCHGKEGIKRKEGTNREIVAGTVTNKSPQHDSLLLKHFIFPQHNGVLLPIICSVSARVDIKWGAAAFSCHFSAVSTLPWRPGCFVVNLPGKQGGVGLREGKCCMGLRCQGVELEEGQQPGPGDMAEWSTAQSWFVMLCLRLINQPFQKHNLYSGGPTRQILLCVASQLNSIVYEIYSHGVVRSSQIPSFYSTHFSSSWYHVTPKLVPILENGFRSLNVHHSEQKKQFHKGHRYLDSVTFFFNRMDLFLRTIKILIYIGFRNHRTFPHHKH